VLFMAEIAPMVSKYQSLRPAEVDYLPSLPAHWRIEKGKWLFKKENRPVNQDDEVVTCFRDGQVTLRSNRRTEGFTNALLEHGYQGIRKADLVIHAMDAFAGAIGVSDSDGKSSPVYAACTPITPKLVNPYFYAYFMRDLALSGYLISLAKGIRERSTDFRFKDFGELSLPVFPFEEQSLIVSFLDKKLTKIDGAIQVKESQIELLKERKQILIQQVVTRGLDPYATMRDSGIEWIGEIPEHWEVVFNRRLFREKSRPVQGDELPLSLSQVDGVIPSGEMTERSLSPAHRKNFKLCFPGDLVVNRFKGHLGVFFESAFEGVVTFHYGVFEPQKGVVTKYFEHLFHTEPYKTIYAGASNGMTVGLQNLSNNNFYAVKSLRPSVDEQTEICRYIEDNSAPLDRAIKNISSQIERLKEYKATLINSAVTGKIKVPGVVEPAEIQEREFA